MENLYLLLTTYYRFPPLYRLRSTLSRRELGPYSRPQQVLSGPHLRYLWKYFVGEVLVIVLNLTSQDLVPDLEVRRYVLELHFTELSEALHLILEIWYTYRYLLSTCSLLVPELCLLHVPLLAVVEEPVWSLPLLGVPTLVQRCGTEVVSARTRYSTYVDLRYRTWVELPTTPSHLLLPLPEDSTDLTVTLYLLSMRHCENLEVRRRRFRILLQYLSTEVLAEYVRCREEVPPGLDPATVKVKPGYIPYLGLVRRYVSRYPCEGSGGSG